MTHSTETPELHVIAREPFRVYYDGPASALSAINRVGQFDILPGHADFFSVLDPGDVTIDTASGPVTFSINNGIVTVRDNQVMMFVNM
jgi:F-type H+-transporting ATPase subunit epsilon